MERINDYNQVASALSEWIKNKIENTGHIGAVVGMSGGIDSAVTSVLCKNAFPENTLGLILPCESDREDAEDAHLVADKFSIPCYEISLTDSFRHLLKKYNTINKEMVEHHSFSDKKKMAEANIKPRLRMITLYYYAAQTNSLVVGTDNKSEIKLGYFTKYGDGGVDLAPLGALVKTEVKSLARKLGVPKKIIEKPPSAGLWKGQKDEDELGMSYKEIDRYILKGSATREVKSEVDRLEKKGRHKLNPPLIPNFFNDNA